MMSAFEIIPKLEKEWDQNGFLGALRSGNFQTERYKQFINLLQNIEAENELIDKRLVALTWYIPLFMNWQKERVLEKGGDIELLDTVINQVTTLLEEKLGVP